MKETYIHGFKVKYEDNAYSGARYLAYNLEYNEARIFFDRARSRGSAPFETNYGKDYTLFYEDGCYIIRKR